MTLEEQKIADEAVSFAKSNKKILRDGEQIRRCIRPNWVSLYPFLWQVRRGQERRRRPLRC